MRQSGEICQAFHTEDGLAKRTIEQCVLTFLSTIAFCLHTSWRTVLLFTSFFCSPLRPSAPVFVATKKPLTRGISRSSSLLNFWTAKCLTEF